jgi:hypothetical protein
VGLLADAKVLASERKGKRRQTTTSLSKSSGALKDPAALRKALVGRGLQFPEEQMKSMEASLSALQLLELVL